MKALSKRWMARADAFAERTTARTTLPHASAETVVHHEGGTALGATRTEWRHTFSTAHLPTRTVRETTTGVGTLGAVSSPATWGSAPAYAFPGTSSGTMRRRVSTFDLQNRVFASRRLVGFVCQATEARHPDRATARRWTAWRRR